MGLKSAIHNQEQVITMCVQLVFIKQSDYLLLYEQNWLKEGTEKLVLKKPAESNR